MTLSRSLAFVRPWGTTWQLWRRKSAGASWFVAQKGDLESIKVPNDAMVALPTRAVVAYAFWVDSTDESVVREMALLEVEMKGLATGERLTTDAEIRILEKEDTRTLVQAIVFPADWDRGWEPLRRSQVFGPAPLFSALPDGAVHLWRELEDIVLSVVWKGQVICWETIDGEATQQELESRLFCFVLQLQSELGIAMPLRFMDWAGIFHGTPAGLRGDLAIADGDRLDGPAVNPSGRSSWVPESVRQTRRAKQARASIFKVAAVVGVLLVAGVSYGVYGVMALRNQIREVEAQISNLNAEIAPLRKTAARWAQIQPAVDKSFFPLEILHVIVASMPREGLRLTVFEMTPEKILVQGEAKNVSIVTEFYQSLQENDDASYLLWTMPPPSLQANSTARFVINAERKERE